MEAAENEVEKGIPGSNRAGRNRANFLRGKKGSECVGAALIKCDGNVLPLFAHPSGYGRIALAYGK